MNRALTKCPTGILGFDEVTHGGLPRGRPTLICGGAGCGKTLFGIEFLARGASEFGEPGVLVSFEEREQDLIENSRSLGFDLKGLVAAKKLALDYVRLERGEIQESGEYDLEGLFVRVDQAIRSVKAKRVVLDTIEGLFAGLGNPGILRAELRRLFYWLKEKGITAVITGERGEGRNLTRQGLEEYVSDCVVTLDQRMEGLTATRHLRIVKYRGSTHGTNEYPFLIDEGGISVLPITSLDLDYPVSDARMSTGVPELDDMLGGKGYYRGSTIMVSGTAGAGKSTLAAHLIEAAAAAGERCVYFSFEESPRQIVRNMGTVGIRLAPLEKRGLLSFASGRPSLYGLETHLVVMRRVVERTRATMVVIDPVTDLMSVGSAAEVRSMLTRMVDFLKGRGITTFMTSLTAAGEGAESSSAKVSSMVDTWLLVRNIEAEGVRRRGLYVLKSRGMPHSNLIREFRVTDRGVELRPFETPAPGAAGPPDAWPARAPAQRAGIVRRHSGAHPRRHPLTGATNA
jgi:circadian clock protein KaiC